MTDFCGVPIYPFFPLRSALIKLNKSYLPLSKKLTRTRITGLINKKKKKREKKGITEIGYNTFSRRYNFSRSETGMEQFD